MKRDEYKMTQQVDTTDYKEKYKEALKVASQWHKDAIGDVKTIVECIFPELRESEDEKWRNWLIGHLEGYINQTDDKYAEVCKKAIAWLEKQGEQQPADNIESSAFKDKLLELFQKFRYIKEGIPTNGDIIEYIDAHIQELIDTLQNKPWSEEDEKMVEDIIEAIDTQYAVSDYNEMVSWLKSIRPQNRWKPSDLQLEALESAYKQLPNIQHFLQSLYNDLKKL